ncbi:hypothetical protein TPHA_0C04700 [Tetrapisispora phaffii CBS 4417]|uniref:Signal recognition particle SEC65 subunit n=1 Tax=Tetrapisispora phaffii (strain ATCC 24235 / CBS 4417 / NBRC 1672 / NRRL Y-8282 / UCD 70-5) TaxID=1071381 RepID=G8BQV8_TETPH|nr:hypothetical protein TPHA_0C04700 [Tetrapisispora phaffii CBS 4417]CCE62620.1 hypothetical protein TPHA_0C04700 [Tetrapisispora phaffii CBS 4417]
MPKLEEIENYDDIDNMEMDLAELDPSLNTPIAPKIVTTVVRSQDLEDNKEPPLVPLSDNSEQINFINPQTGQVEGSARMSKQELQEVKGFQVIYPCYFDVNRSHKEGRRVSKELAVENPLAKTVADAVRELGVLCIFEGDKCHPQDFGNPGRVRVLIKEQGTTVVTASSYSSGGKRQLLNDIAKYLQKNPTTIEKLREIPYGPEFDNIEFKRVPKVKGFKMNDIVPLHSSYLMGHPMVKGLYDAPPPPVTHANTQGKLKMPKNKYKVVRR